MARSFRTLSLSLPPGVVQELAAIGASTARTAARVAAEIVLREVSRMVAPRQQTWQKSWCCQARVVPNRSQLVMPEADDGGRRWMPAVVLLCDACERQMHGREYEGWLTDA